MPYSALSSPIPYSSSSIDSCTINTDICIFQPALSPAIKRGISWRSLKYNDISFIYCRKSGGGFYLWFQFWSQGISWNHFWESMGVSDSKKQGPHRLLLPPPPYPHPPTPLPSTPHALSIKVLRCWGRDRQVVYCCPPSQCLYCLISAGTPDHTWRQYMFYWSTSKSRGCFRILSEAGVGAALGAISTWEEPIGGVAACCHRVYSRPAPGIIELSTPWPAARLSVIRGSVTHLMRESGM